MQTKENVCFVRTTYRLGGKKIAKKELCMLLGKEYVERVTEAYKRGYLSDILICLDVYTRAGMLNLKFD